MVSDRKVISGWTDTLNLEYHAKIGRRGVLKLPHPEGENDVL